MAMMKVSIVSRCQCSEANAGKLPLSQSLLEVGQDYRRGPEASIFFTTSSLKRRVVVEEGQRRSTLEGS
jgi:hypothetical protein